MRLVLIFSRLRVRMFRRLSGIRRRATHICISSSQEAPQIKSAGAQVRRRFLVRVWLGLLSGALCNYLCSIVEAHGVILHELLHVTMSPARVEIELLHLRIYLIVVPVIAIKAIDSSHHTCAMP